MDVHSTQCIHSLISVIQWGLFQSVKKKTANPSLFLKCLFSAPRAPFWTPGPIFNVYSSRTNRFSILLKSNQWDRVILSLWEWTRMISAIIRSGQIWPKKRTGFGGGSLFASEFDWIWQLSETAKSWSLHSGMLDVRLSHLSPFKTILKRLLILLSWENPSFWGFPVRDTTGLLCDLRLIRAPIQLFEQEVWFLWRISIMNDLRTWFVSDTT